MFSHALKKNCCFNTTTTTTTTNKNNNNNDNNNNNNNNSNNSVPPGGSQSDLLILPKETENISLSSLFPGNVPRHAGACFVLSKVKPAFPVYWYTRPQQWWLHFPFWPLSKNDAVFQLSITKQIICRRIQLIGIFIAQEMARFVLIFGINSTRNIWDFLNHECYLCQISRTNHAIICLY